MTATRRHDPVGGEGSSGTGGPCAGRPTVSAERGSGTVLVLGGLGVVTAVTAAALQVGTAAAAAHRARAAADLSALAGATAVQAGWGDPCGQAQAVARRNGARVSSCVLVGAEQVLVRVSTTVATAWPGVPNRATASALAGPAGVGNPGPAKV